MMPSNSNYVCVKHRTNAKGANACPVCGKNMIPIGTRWRIPKKSDNKGWNELAKKFQNNIPIYDGI